jgi:hypothetical protein
MATTNTITSVNAILTISVAPLFPAPQQIKGFTAEVAFEVEPVDIAEIRLGVDGILSTGFIPYVTPMTIHLMADSPSITIFETWAATERTLIDKLAATGTVALPSVSRKYALSNGFLTRYHAISSARRVLEERQIQITWGDIVPAVFA